MLAPAGAALCAAWGVVTLGGTGAVSAAAATAAGSTRTPAAGVSATPDGAGAARHVPGPDVLARVWPARSITRTGPVAATPAAVTADSSVTPMVAGISPAGSGATVAPW